VNRSVGRERARTTWRSSLLVAVSTLTLTAWAGSAAAAPSPRFNPPKGSYLALGDSFSFGYQVTRFSIPPDAAAFDHGFVDQLTVQLRAIQPRIATVNYGCPGESTATFIDGGCPWMDQGYPLHDPFVGSQLDAAVSFLRAHPGEVSPITISLALNDVQGFIQDCAFDPACIQQGAPAAIEQITTNLGAILDGVRAASPASEVIVMGPYDPFIDNLPFADPLFAALNDTMARTASNAGARYADIFPAFNPQGDLGAEIKTLCELTLICTYGDGHPSDLGYEVMADTSFDASGYQRPVA
jgi:lysophospholipase L1-like esterase